MNFTPEQFKQINAIVNILLHDPRKDAYQESTREHAFQRMYLTAVYVYLAIAKVDAVQLCDYLMTKLPQPHHMKTVFGEVPRDVLGAYTKVWVRDLAPLFSEIADKGPDIKFYSVQTLITKGATLANRTKHREPNNMDHPTRTLRRAWIHELATIVPNPALLATIHEDIAVRNKTTA
jgi:hypothetical protein